MVRIDLICVEISAIEDLFCVISFPCETCNLGSWAQKFERVWKDNDYEVLNWRPEIKFQDQDTTGVVLFYQGTKIGLN